MDTVPHRTILEETLSEKFQEVDWKSAEQVTLCVCHDFKELWLAAPA